MRPSISINGSKVTVQVRGQSTVHSTHSHDEAIALAGELEAAAIADEEKRAALLESYIEQGIDVVRPALEPEPVAARIDPGSILNPAAVQAAMPTPPPDVAPAPQPELLVDQSQTSNPAEPDWTVQAVPAPLPATAEVSWDAERDKVAVSIVPLADAKLWRSVAGKTSTFDVKEGKPHTRSWSGQPGDKIEVRVGDEDGQIILFDQVPGPEESPESE